MSESLVMPTIKIDPEFQNKIPPLTDAEFEQLKENILNAGEVWEPIVVWNGTIVDGHNRYRIVSEHPEIKWRTRDVEFTDKWEAFEWMYKNQLGRRNLTEQQRAYMIGKMLESRKRSVGEHKGNQYTQLEARENRGFPSERTKREIKDGTSAIIANELGIGATTVRDNEKFAKGIDTIKEEDPEFANEILIGKKNVNKTDVMNIARAKEEKRAEMIEAIKNREPLNPKPKKERPRFMIPSTTENRQLSENIAASIEELKDTDTKSEYTIEMFLTVIRMGAERYVKSLQNDIEFHKELLEEESNRQMISETITESIINEMKKIKESIENESGRIQMGTEGTVSVRTED